MSRMASHPILICQSLSSISSAQKKLLEPRTCTGCSAEKEEELASLSVCWESERGTAGGLAQVTFIDWRGWESPGPICNRNLGVRALTWRQLPAVHKISISDFCIYTNLHEKSLLFPPTLVPKSLLLYWTSATLIQCFQAYNVTSPNLKVTLNNAFITI